MAITGLGMRRVVLAAIFLGGACVFPKSALTEEIALRSADGLIDFSGQFVALDDDHYIVRTALGELRVRADRVDCLESACPIIGGSNADVRFAGSNALGLGLMPLLLEGYASFLDANASFSDTRIASETLADLVAADGYGDGIGSYLVSSTVSGDAFEALLTERAHFGMTSRRITPTEARALRDAGAGNMISPNQEHIVAIDSLVVITHPSNPVREITMAQLGDVFAGRITNWKDLGGSDMPIKVINRQIDSGTRSVFYAAIFGDNTPQAQLANEVVAEDNNAAARMVNEDPGAIGFVGHAFQRGASPMTLINECGMPTEPDAFSAKVEEYTLQRRLYFYNRADGLPEKAAEFLEYATSENADGVISKSGFIDLGIERKKQDLNGPRARMLLDPNVDAYEGGVMRQMLAEMVNYDRLSTTFRFRTGSSKLDERGALDLKRLADYLETIPKGTRVMFVGFTDNVGAFDRNRSLSLSRARKVAAELKAYAGEQVSGIEFDFKGFGEIAPSACNVSENGRAINRRVEVWIETDRSI